MINRMVRKFARLSLEIAQILILTIGCALMAIGKLYIKAISRAADIMKEHSEELLSALWLAAYALVFVKIIKAIVSIIRK